MATITVETTCCETCYLLIALGLPDFPEPADLEAAAKVIAYSERNHVHLYPADGNDGYEDDAGFSWYPCHICNDSSGGLRYQVVGLAR